MNLLLTKRLDPELLARLRKALDVSWDKATSYNGVELQGVPSFGQCYPTSRVVQHYFPETEILKGLVCSNGNEEVHFWNGLPDGEHWHHIDLSWQQFPAGSYVKEFEALDRTNLLDSAATQWRCAELLKRVQTHLLAKS